MGHSFALLKKKTVAYPTVIVTAAAAGIMSMAIVGPRDSGAARLLQQTTSALEEYLNRSPGERDETALLKGKGKGKGKSGAMASREIPTGEPEQQALGKVFEEPGVVPDTLPGAEPIADALPESLALATPPDVLAPGGFAPIGPGGGGGGIIGGGGNPGGGGGGGGTPGGPGDGGGDPPPVSPVPEPSTWALMLLGFFFSGGALRSKARATRAAHHA